MLSKILRYSARSVLIVTASFWFVFALLSGAEKLGGGIMGVINNSPNAIPFLLLWGIVFIAWKWELVGGILLMSISLLMGVLFDVFQGEGLFALFLIVLPIFLTGLALVIASKLKK